jgi:Zn-dependent protease with chaperone function
MTRDARLLDLPLSVCVSLIAEYTKRIGWLIVAEQANEAGVLITTQRQVKTTLRAILFREPQVAVWQLSWNGLARIELSFPAPRRSTLITAFIVSMPVLGYLYGTTTMRLKGPVGAVGLLVGAAAVCSYPLLAVWLCNRRRHSAFVESFYNRVHEETGKHPEATRALVAPPGAWLIFPLVTGLFLSGYLRRLIIGPPLGIRDWITIASILLVAGVVLSLIPRITRHAASTPFVPAYPLVGVAFGVAWTPLSFVSASALLDYPANGVQGLAHTLYVGLLISVPVSTALILFTGTELVSRLRERLLPDRAPGEGKLTVPFEPSWSPGILPFVLAAWLAIGLLNLVGLSFAVAAFQYLLLGDIYLLYAGLAKPLSSLKPQYILRLLLAFYSLPYIAVMTVVVFRWLRELHLTRSAHRLVPPAELIDTLDAICSWANIRRPLVLIETTAAIRCSTARVFLVGDVLKISKGTLDSLDGDSLEAILAHEVRHIQRHLRAFWFCDLLSRLTLFGDRFLPCMILNAPRMEYDADAFSVAWLAHRGVSSPREALITALLKITVLNSLPLAAASSGPALAFGSSRMLSNLAAPRLMDRLRLFWSAYFGDLAEAYTHPSTNVRIRRLEAAR